MGDLVFFAGQVKRISDAIPIVVNDVTIEMVARIDSHLVSVNPVDTGRSRANWIISLNVSDSSLNVQEEEGIPGAGVQFADQSLSEISKLSGRKNEDTIFLQNNTSYIEKLNSGSSSQAPAGFAQTAIMQELAVFKNTPIVATACKRV